MSQQMVRPIGGGSYGDGKDFAAIQSGAPMAAAAGPTRDATPVSPEAAGLVPFGADSQAPDQPVTSGADAGPGPGSSVLGGPSPDMVGADAQTMAQYIPVWEKIVNLPGSTPSARAALLRLKARLG